MTLNGFRLIPQALDAAAQAALADAVAMAADAAHAVSSADDAAR